MENAAIKAKMDGAVHNSHMWREVAGGIPDCTGEQCHDRWTYLKRRYRETKKKTTHQDAEGPPVHFMMNWTEFLVCERLQSVAL